MIVAKIRSFPLMISIKCLLKGDESSEDGLQSREGWIWIFLSLNLEVCAMAGEG